MFPTNVEIQEIMVCISNEKLAKCSMQGRNKERILRRDGGKCSLQPYSQ